MTATQSVTQLPEAPTPAGWQVSIFSHTHWDREWYQPFERFRMQLVGAIDNIVETLETDPDYTVYTLDGQTIVLDDYLVARPEMRERLSKLIGAGRIEVGPWYILPDEFLVSGESLVRNLLEGRRGASRFAEPMPVGYIPDPFGHVAQMPQILHGFGIDTAVFSRGMGDEFAQLGSEFDWAAPDGTTVVAIVQTSPVTTGYCNGEKLSALHGEADLERVLGIGTDLALYLTGAATTPVLLIAAGCDHETINPNLPNVARALEARLPGASVRLVGLRDVAREVVAMADVTRAAGTFGRFQGELRGSLHSPILAAIFSARIPLKQDNARLQTLLERYVEPFTALASWSGLHRSQPGLERHAWRLALQNQPHDSIGGCSVDSVHREMPVRTKRARDVAFGMLQELTASLGAVAEPVVLNPHPFEVTALAHRVDGDELFVGPLAPLAAVPLSRAASVASSTSVVDERTIASDLVRVHASETGLVRIAALDGSGNETAVVEDALRFVDLGDAGDEYDFGSLPGDRPELSQLTDVHAVRLESGAARLELTHTLALPTGLTADRRARSAERVETTLHTTITVVDGQPWAECRTSWVNASTDHRLRVQTQLPARADLAHADGHFAFVTRPARPAEPQAQWSQQPVTSSYVEHAVTATDSTAPGGAHVALLGEGLHEYELTGVHPDGHADALELTILRAVGWLSREDIPGRPGHAGPPVATPDAQSLGMHAVRFGIAPYAGGFEPDWLAQVAARFAASPLVLEPVAETIRDSTGNYARLRDLAYVTRSGATLDDLTAAGIEVQGAQLSAVKLADDDSGELIVRVWNPGPESVDAVVRVPGAVRAARVRLDETGDTPVTIEDGVARFPIGAGEIATLRYPRP